MVRCCLLYIALMLLPGCAAMMPLKDETAAPKANYDWPLADAPQYLEKSKEMEVADVMDMDGKSAQFAVFQEYTSATGERCKKYYVNKTSYLACYGREWQPVRFFGE